MTPRRKHLPLGLFLLGALTLSLTGYATRSKTHQRPALITLQSSGGVIETSGPVSAVSASDDGQTLYTVDGLTGEVDAYGSQPGGKLTHLGKTVGAVKGPRGCSATADKGQRVTVWDGAGRFAANFKTYPADSLAFLGNGNLLVASPADGHFIHVYSPQGQLLRSFGVFKRFDDDEGQNQFLHRGKVLVDAADNVYYAYRYVPLIQKYSPDGALLREINVTGAAVDIQQRVAERFFANRQADQIGGIHILTAAALDRRTGHLWVGMNGSSTTGVVYEYDEQGEKLREYALEAVSPYARERVTGVADIAVTDSNLHVLTTLHQVHSFSRAVTSARTISPNLSARFEGFGLFVAPRTLPFAAAAMIQSCAAPQTWPGCPFTCPQPVCVGAQPTDTSSNGAHLDCKNAIQSSLTGSYTVVNSSCSQINPGTTNHMRGGCTSSVTTCIDGTNVTHSATLDCPAPVCTPPGGGCDFEACNDGEHWNSDECCCANNNTGQCVSPILIDVSGDGFNLTDAAHGVLFDLKPDGAKERLAWTAAGSDDAWLALDRNGNGVIDDGTELFGNFTPQPQPPAGTSRNGFLALAEYDRQGNGDGVIDGRDAAFSSLRLWQDANHNGVSEPGELHALPELGVASIELDYKRSNRIDQYGNQFRYRAKVRDAHGAQVGRWAWDVFLVVGQ